jgi:hypothetical protein
MRISELQEIVSLLHQMKSVSFLDNNSSAEELIKNLEEKVKESLNEHLIYIMRCSSSLLPPPDSKLLERLVAGNTIGDILCQGLSDQPRSDTLTKPPSVSIDTSTILCLLWIQPEVLKRFLNTSIA